MAKSEAGMAAAARTAGELKRELKRLVKAIVDEDDGRIETFEEASRALEALRDLRFSGSENGKRCSSIERKKDGVDSAAVPDHFLCPISSEIMRDPVVLASGQTYDRPFIQEWLNSGNRTCPQTQQVLTNPTLTPNHLIRSMISQWSSEQGIPLPPLDNPDDGLITARDRKSLNSLLNLLSSESQSEKKQAVKDLRLLTKQKSSFRALVGQCPEVIPQLVSVLLAPGLSNDLQLQEDTVTAILNLSIHDSNKKIVGDDLQAIPLLIDALQTGTMDTRSNAAAALFTLSALDSNKIKIGELGAMTPLVELLEHGSPMAKKDAASAIFNLCMAHENRTRAVREGVAAVLLRTIADRLLVDESLAILAMLSSDQEAVEEIAECDGVACLLKIIRENSCPRNKENAVVVLFSICMSHRRKLREISEEEGLNGTIRELANSGTSRARRKAAGILERLRRTMHNTHYSC